MEEWEVGGSERLGNPVTNQKVAGLIPVPNDVVSLGKALYPTWLGGMSLYFPVSSSG